MLNCSFNWYLTKILISSWSGENMFSKSSFLLVFRFLGPGGGQDDWVWTPHHPGASSVCSDSNSTRGEGSEEGAGCHQGPGGILLPASGKRWLALWPVWKDGEDGATGLLGQRWSSSRSVSQSSVFCFFFLHVKHVSYPLCVLCGCCRFR